jgi:hypothetical protein
MSSLDNILDATLDDLADMPSIQLFPNGAHKVTLGFKVDKVKAAVQVMLTYVEPLEFAEPTAVAPAPGDKNGVFISLKKKDGTPNEYGQGTLKQIAQALAKTFPGSSTAEILEAAEGAEVAVVTKIRYGKGEYEGKDNLDIIKLEVI